ncbi:glycosyltransferase family 4 protein [Patescibacteria group bacterium]|nr:glycosyltransferase family 4 protein [Patescibacteria group bacterium]
MKILGLSLENSILDPFSPQAKRVIEYGRLVEKYTFIVLSDKETVVDLSERVRVYGIKKKGKFFDFFSIFRLAEKFSAGQAFDVISVQDHYYLALIALIISKKFNLGLELQVHGFEKFGGLRKLVAKYVLSRAGAVRAVSQRLKAGLIKDFKVEEEKITVVPIYTELRIKNKESIIKNESKFIFLTVGRLVPIKNIALQIEAMAKIVRKYEAAELWVVGEGPEKQNLQKLSSNLRIGDSVKFWGRQEDPEKFYVQADVFLLTSNYEGWGLAVIEAAGYGLPIVMTDVGCAREIIRENERGIIIPINDRKNLEQAMFNLLENKELRKRLGLGARLALEKLPGKEETLNLYKISWGKAVKNKK